MTPDPYNPSASPKGTGTRIATIVLSTLGVVVLAAAWHLHAFWWQS